MTLQKLLAANAALSGQVQRSQEALKIALLSVEKLKVEVAYLRRMKFGRSSDQLEHAQLDLVGGQLAQPAQTCAAQADDAADNEQPSNVMSLEQARKKRQAKERSGVRELPAHLPRRIVEHLPHGGCDCEACGRVLREIGQDVSEVLDYVPGTCRAWLAPHSAVAQLRADTESRAEASRSEQTDPQHGGTDFDLHRIARQPVFEAVFRARICHR